MRRWILMGAVLILAACATEPPASAPPPPAPMTVVQIPALPVQPPPPRPAPDTCGASALQSIVGRPRTEIPVPVDPGHRRVLCSTCPMTQDYNPSRQTILFDTQSGLVTSVKCG